jgi:hypothetical protein
MGSSELRNQAADHPVKAARLARAKDHRLVDVAAAAEISTSYLSMIEHGLVPPPAVQGRIAAVLGSPVEELWAT